MLNNIFNKGKILYSTKVRVNCHKSNKNKINVSEELLNG